MDETDAKTAENGALDGLRAAKAGQVDLAERLLREGRPVDDVQAQFARINDDLHRRALDHALAAMRADDRGVPPVAFTLIVMGSVGRGESVLHPDQDNGFVLDDYDDDAHDRIDGWFIALAEHLTATLDGIGFPLCPGYVMATNPLWRKRRSEWAEQVALWSRKRNSAALSLCDIFFDFRAVAGETAFAEALRDDVVATTRGNAAFLEELWQEDSDDRVALGWFGRFVTLEAPPELRGWLDLKHAGAVPLIEAARLMALRDGVRETGTLARLAVLRDLGRIEAGEHDALAAAYRHVAGLILSRQIAAARTGGRVTHCVDPKTLSRDEAARLKAGFRAIRNLRDRLRHELAAEVF